MATASNWDDDEDHATFVRISELEKALEEAKSHLGSKCVNPSKPRKTASKQPSLAALPENRTLERACVLSEEPDTHVARSILPPLSQGQNSDHGTAELVRNDSSSTNAPVDSTPAESEKEMRKRQKKASKRAAAKAELERLRQENKKIEDEHMEVSDILVKLDQDIEMEKVRIAKTNSTTKPMKIDKVESYAGAVMAPEGKPLVTKPKVKVKAPVTPVVDGTALEDEAEALKREIATQELEAKAIRSRRHMVTQALHQMKKAQQVQICLTGDVYHDSTKQILQYMHLNISNVIGHLSPVFPKLAATSGLVLQKGDVFPEVTEFAPSHGDIKWKYKNANEYYYRTDVHGLLQSSGRLNWEENSSKILILVLKESLAPTYIRSIFEVLQNGLKITKLFVLFESPVDAGTKYQWIQQQASPTRSWISFHHASKENAIHLLSSIVKSSLFQQEQMLHMMSIFGHPRNGSLPAYQTSLRGVITSPAMSGHSKLLTAVELTNLCQSSANMTKNHKNGELIIQPLVVLENDRYVVRNGSLTLKNVHVRLLQNSDTDPKTHLDLTESMHVSSLMGKQFCLCSKMQKIEFESWHLIQASEETLILQPVSIFGQLLAKEDEFGSQSLFQALQAFSHWTHEKSNGYLLVDVREVLSNGTKCLVSDVIVYCKDLLRFSSMNLGVPGIETFFSRHTCNDLCRRLSLPSHPKQVWVTPIKVTEPKVESSPSFVSKAYNKVTSYWSPASPTSCSQESENPKPQVLKVEHKGSAAGTQHERCGKNKSSGTHEMRNERQEGIVEKQSCKNPSSSHDVPSSNGTSRKEKSPSPQNWEGSLREYPDPSPQQRSSRRDIAEAPRVISNSPSKGARARSGSAPKNERKQETLTPRTRSASPRPTGKSSKGAVNDSGCCEKKKTGSGNAMPKIDAPLMPPKTEIKIKGKKKR